MQLPDFTLKDRVALITGAGRGMGLAIAQAYALAGASVAIQDIDESVAQAEAKKIVDAGGRAVAFGGDMGDLNVMNSLVQKTVDALGGLHLLVNNAAIQGGHYWVEDKPETMIQQWTVNMMGPFVLCQKAVPIFRTQKFGRIINIGSVQCYHGSTYMLPYAMSKGALMTFTHALAADLAKDNITVNVMLPGYFNTYRNRGAFKNPGDLEREGKRAVLIGRIGEPQDVAGAALLLASPAGSYITGISLTVDGGQLNRS